MSLPSAFFFLNPFFGVKGVLIYAFAINPVFDFSSVEVAGSPDDPTRCECWSLHPFRSCHLILATILAAEQEVLVG